MVKTRNDLERDINNWMLDTSSDAKMYESLFNIIHMLTKVSEEKFVEPDIPALLREVISRIQRQQNVPRIVREKLYEARLRIREEDSLSDGLKTIVAGHPWFEGLPGLIPINQLSLSLLNGRRIQR
jgi:hypothetical protein